MHLSPLFFVACTGSPATVPTPATPVLSGFDYTGSLGPEPSFDAADGLLKARVADVESLALIEGRFLDGDPLRLHTEGERQGQRRVLRYVSTFCDPACDSSSACVDGDCVAYPASYDVGTITWTYGGTSVDVEPNGMGTYYEVVEGVQGGASTEVTFDGITLAVGPVEPMLLDTPAEEVLSSRAGGAVLTWSNPHPGARVRLQMTDCTGSHGGLAEAEIECEGPDTGTFVIPGAFLDELEAGAWDRGECGSHVFERYAAAARDDDHQIRLEVVGAPQGFFWRPE